MEELARLYVSNFKDVVYLPTNSRSGTIAGLGVVIPTLFKLPVYRVKGKKILHIHVASGKSFFRKTAIAVFGRILGYKIIMHSHAGDFPDFVKKAGRFIVRNGLKPAHEIIVLSDSWKRYFSDFLACKNVSVVPNLVCVSLLERECHNNEKVRFLYLGVLTKEKGVDLLVRSYKTVSDRFKAKTQLVIAGAGPLEKQLKDFAEKEIKNGDIVFTGWVNHETRDRLLKAADVVVLPSLFECQPMSLLEGMAAGCGIVATRTGGIPDIVKDGENGILVECGDIDGLADGMIQYINDRELVARHAVNSMKIIERHTPEKVTDTLNKIYKDIMDV